MARSDPRVKPGDDGPAMTDQDALSRSLTHSLNFFHTIVGASRATTMPMAQRRRHHRRLGQRRAERFRAQGRHDVVGRRQDHQAGHRDLFGRGRLAADAPFAASGAVLAISFAQTFERRRLRQGAAVVEPVPQRDEAQCGGSLVSRFCSDPEIP